MTADMVSDSANKIPPPSDARAWPINVRGWHLLIALHGFVAMIIVITVACVPESAYYSPPAYSIAAPGANLTSTPLLIRIDPTGTLKMNYTCSEATINLSHYGISLGHATLPRVDLLDMDVALLMLPLDGVVAVEDRKEDGLLVREIVRRAMDFDATIYVTTNSSNQFGGKFDSVSYMVYCPAVKVTQELVEGVAVRPTFSPCKISSL